MDKIRHDFLLEQQRRAQELANCSDIFSYTPIAGDPPWRYLLEFNCTGMIRTDDRIGDAEHFVVGLSFGPDHLRQPPEIPALLTWLEPPNVWHPNIRYPFICIGDVEPGIGIVDIAHRVYEIITFQKVTPVEWNALNKDACSFARSNMERFPLDARPLRRPRRLPPPDQDAEARP